MSDSVWPLKRQPTRLPHPWDSPSKNTGVGCQCLLQCMKVKSESEVTQLCLTLSDPMDCSPPGSSIHRIFQSRVLEWGAIAFSATKTQCCKKKKKVKPNPGSPKEGDRDSRRNTPIEKKYQPFPHTEVRGKAGWGRPPSPDQHLSVYPSIPLPSPWPSHDSPLPAVSLSLQPVHPAGTDTGPAVVQVAHLGAHSWEIQLCCEVQVPRRSREPLKLTIFVSLPHECCFPGGASGKEPACQCRRHKRPVWSLGQEGEHVNPLQYSCLENPMDRGAWHASVHKVT